MIRNLFTKHEHRVLTGITKEQAVQAAAWYWRSRQFGINFASAYNLTGAQFYSRLGLRQQVSVSSFDMGPGVGVDVDFSAELTDEGVVAGAIGAVLVLPAVVAVGAVSYVEYENDASRLLSDFWTYMSNHGSSAGPPTGPPPSPSWAEAKPAAAAAPGSPRQCPSCRAYTEPDARFCKYCGTWL